MDCNRRVRRVGSKVCTFLGFQSREGVRLSVSHLSPSEFGSHYQLAAAPDPPVCNSNPAQPASISVFLKEVLSLFWGSWNVPPFLAVTHWSQG